jgi:protein-S-isoprenylcysteine O-methyltransferase Ste14
MDRSALAVSVVLVVALAAFELQPRRLVFARSDRLSGPFIALSLGTIALVAIAERGKPQIAFVSLGLAAALAGLALRVAALRALGRDYSYVAERPTSVCTRGAYRYARHPAYLGTCLYAVAAPLAFSSPAAGLLAPLTILAIAYRIRIEERLLDQQPGYAEYRRRTAALIPFLL